MVEKKKSSPNTLMWVAAGLGALGLFGGLVLWTQIPEVYVTNGLNQSVLLRIDEQELELQSNDWQQLQGVSRSTEQAQVSIDQGKTWTSIPVDLSLGTRAAVINPYGAAWVYTQAIVYSVSADQDGGNTVQHCGESFLRVDQADYRFSAPPDEVEVSTESSYTTKWLLHVDGGVDACLFSLTSAGANKKAAILAEVELDPTIESEVMQLNGLQSTNMSESEHAQWLAQATERHGTLPFKELQLQLLLAGPEAAATVQGLKERHEADPQDAVATYLYAAALPDEEALPLLLKALEEHPDNPYLNRRSALIYEDMGELEQALPFILRLYPDEQFSDSAHYWAAQNYIRLGQVEPAEAALLESASNNWDAMAALARLRATLPPDIIKAWRDRGALHWLRIYTGEEAHRGADPLVQLSILVVNGTRETLMASPLARQGDLLRALDDYELILVHAIATAEQNSQVLKQTDRILAKRPDLLAAMQSPENATMEQMDELAFAAANMHQLWNGNLSANEARERELLVSFFDPFGLISAPAGWLNDMEEQTTESEELAAEQP